MSGTRPRVVITGAGAVAAPEVGADALWRALLEGRTGARPLDRPWADEMLAPIAAGVRGFDPPEGARTMDPFSQFAVAAAEEAVRAAGLDGVSGPRTAVLIGTGVGGQMSQDDGFRRIYREGARRLTPLTIPRIMPSAAASRVAMVCGVTGPVFAINSACASAGHAIGFASQMVRGGMVDVALAGGSEAMLTYVTIKAWEALRVLAPDACRPFSLGRRGMVLGEGAGVVVLERFESARARGAPVLAEIAGFGMSSDAGDLVRPSAEGAAAAIRAALDDAGIAAEEVDHINAHGTGTRINDAVEAEAIHRVFGDRTGEIAVTATKAVHGHAIAASGAFEAIATARAVREGVIPPIAGFGERDPACDLDVVIGEPRPGPIRCALSNSLAFGGLNAVLAFRRADPAGVSCVRTRGRSCSGRRGVVSPYRAMPAWRPAFRSGDAGLAWRPAFRSGDAGVEAGAPSGGVVCAGGGSRSCC